MTPRMPRLRRALADGWLRLLFWHARHAPWVPRRLKPIITRGTWAAAPAARAATRANAAHLLGPGSTASERTALAKAVLSNCYDAVVDFGANRRLSHGALLARLESIEGEEGYVLARARGRGAILATAHIGPFETSMAMLAKRERAVHVVFRRDQSPLFERLRSEQHARLGVREAPVDDGLTTWIHLRDALAADEVVLLQADRVLPGQPGVAVPFLDGLVRLPTGPVKLARLTGAPLIPVFALRVGGDKVRVIIEAPIWVEEIPLGAPGEPDPALLRLASVIQRFVQAHPEQWLCLHAVWCNDADPADTAGGPAAAARVAGVMGGMEDVGGGPARPVAAIK